MRKKMEELVKQLETMYLTENPVNSNDGSKQKYFLCLYDTHEIVVQTKTISEMVYLLACVIEQERGITDSKGQLINK